MRETYFVNPQWPEFCNKSSGDSGGAKAAHPVSQEWIIFFDAVFTDR